MAELNPFAKIVILSEEMQAFIVNINQPIQFRNYSKDAVDYTWDFGDGSLKSTEYEPTHTFTAVGEYTVSLDARNAVGLSDVFFIRLVVVSNGTGLVAGVFGDPKESCRLASPVNIDIATGGLIMVDGVQSVLNDRILLAFQTDAFESGIYLAKTGSWVRADDANENGDVTQGLHTNVVEGTLYKGFKFLLNTPDPIILGTTDLDFRLIAPEGDKHFELAVVAVTSVNVQHNLAKKPAVSFLDSAALTETVLGEVEYVNNNEINVIFSIPFTGTIICN